jgi:hypothetical protein
MAHKPPRRLCRATSVDKTNNGTQTPLLARAAGAVGFMRG